MTEMVRKADVHRMLIEAMQMGHADDPQLIPNLMGSLRLFTPTFNVELSQEQVTKAERVAAQNVANTTRRIFG